MKQSATPRLDSRDMVRVKTLEIAWHNVDKENVRTYARLDALDSRARFDDDDDAVRAV